MEVTHSFTVPGDPDTAYRVLSDIESIAPCIPGATLDDASGEEYTGWIDIDVGPLSMTYRGVARFAELDREAGRLVLEARGEQEGGEGTAELTIGVSLSADPGGTTVSLTADLTLTGPGDNLPEATINDLGEELVQDFADCVNDELVRRTVADQADLDAGG